MNLKKMVFLIPAIWMCICQSKAQETTISLPLWPNGAPGFEDKKNEAETSGDWWVRNIHQPSITIFPAPQHIAHGGAVVICPGGGFRSLVYNSEGVDAARFLNSIGFTAIVLKYRLFREENSPYTEEQPKQDIFRAMRLVRGLAKQYQIDTARIGVMGFSAGGEVAGWVSYLFDENHAPKPDSIDSLVARPAFQILVYPGPLAVPTALPANAPRSFLLAANNDECCSDPVITLLQMHRKAKVPVEVHLYEQGDHAFNMGLRTKLATIEAWPQRLADWLKDTGMGGMKQ